MDRGPRIAIISGFVESEINRLEGTKFDSRNSEPVGPVHEFNRVFRAALDDGR